MLFIALLCFDFWDEVSLYCWTGLELTILLPRPLEQLGLQAWSAVPNLQRLFYLALHPWILVGVGNRFTLNIKLILNDEEVTGCFKTKVKPGDLPVDGLLRWLPLQRMLLPRWAQLMCRSASVRPIPLWVPPTIWGHVIRCLMETLLDSLRKFQAAVTHCWWLWGKGDLNGAAS